MKDNPTLNTGVGTYHLSFPIMAGQSCYDLRAEVELGLSFFLQNTYTTTTVRTHGNYRTEDVCAILPVCTHRANLCQSFLQT